MPSVDPVARPSSEFTRMDARWKPIEALLGDTPKLRQQAENYLPQGVREPDGAYNIRKDTAWLLNVFLRSIRRLAGKPFQRPITLVDPVSAQVAEWALNIDGEGADLTAFGRGILRDMLAYGVGYIMADMPNVEGIEAEQNGEVLNRAQEAQLGIRPYLCPIKPTTIIGMRSRRVGGLKVLDQVRIRTQETVPDGEFGDKPVTRIRVWTPERIQDWIQTSKTRRFEPLPSIVNRLGMIPLVKIPAVIDGEVTHDPPLETLAYMNLRHFQSQSRQDEAVDAVRAALPVLRGFTNEEIKEWINGANNAIRSERPPSEVDVGFAEPSGKGAEVGFIDLERLEKLMEAFSNEVLMPRTGGQTATANAIQHSESISDLQAMVRNLESGLAQSFGLMGQWINQAIDVNVDVYQDFGIGHSEMDAEQRFKRTAAGLWPQSLLLREDKRRGLMSDSEDVNGVLAEMEEEGTALVGQNGNTL